MSFNLRSLLVAAIVLSYCITWTASRHHYNHNIPLKEEKVGVEYEYSVPSELTPSLDKKYVWVQDTFSECSATCGGGFQTTHITCRSSEDLEMVEDDLCKHEKKPVSQQTCNTDPCLPKWTVSPWSECSERCGDKGTRSRTVTCTLIINGAATLVAENECFTTLGTKPDLFEKCNRDASCPTWFIGNWKNCDKLSGEGNQTRMVQCYQERDHRRIKLDDTECEKNKPETTKPCVLAIFGVDWVATDWTGCDTRRSTVKTRRVQCADRNGTVYEDRFCNHHPVRPTTEEPCNKADLPPCEPIWNAGHWNKSVGCDKELGSSARDKCRVCHGNGTTCHTLKGLHNQTVTTEDFTQGYQDILVMAAGATTIVIEKFKPSKNYLALRNKEGYFFLKGDHQNNSSENLMIAGAVCHYERNYTGSLASEKLICSGPTNETLHLSILLKEGNVGIETELSVPVMYEYSVPNKKYEWIHDILSPCNATCGGGYQTSNVTCRSSENSEDVEDDLCDPDMKPVSQQTCNTDPCPPECTMGPWSACSERSGGTRNRMVTCTQSIDGMSSVVTKLDVFENCNTDVPCPAWRNNDEMFVGEFTSQSTTEGEQNLGSCRSSLHGCCEDNVTPAHGPQFEGCCLLTSFGCCPDNHKAAEGLDFEGCECQHALHGCCPDNETIAQGPNNEGCGCQYTEFGCCPDRHTPASGPKNEGCSCHTYQFGCCPDGVSISEGPNFQGCDCSRSKFGCCGDEKTAATGSDGVGCDCSNSKYGCCLDGQSAATGPDFLGCKAFTENRQAACGLPSETGSCIDYELRWYYNTTYGGCTQFWYRGCDGNLNKFSSRDECEGVCVHPSPKDACHLPSVKGPCDDNVIRWYFNSDRKLCEQFAYGNCLGNDNNFETRELCQKQCVADRDTDTCELPIEQGQCTGNFSRWGYNSESRRCEQFTWGGCEGNVNRFTSEAACKLRCDTPSSVCSEPQETGNCTDKEAVWSFSQTENRCMPFYYSGCDGNHNRFDSRNNCEQTCPSSYKRDRCTLPTESGECRNYELKWFFDTSYQRCRQFYFGGCGGNENRFETLMECESACSEPFPTTTTTTTTTTTSTSTSTSTTTTTVGPLSPPVQTQPPRERDAFCYLAIVEGGLCESAPVKTRYAYEPTLGKCVAFQHQGCGGNQNNFESEEYCMTYCQPVEDVCQLPMKSGPCDGFIMSWFYDASSDSCSQFTYGGCEGNDNRFDTREDCEIICRRAAPQPSVTTLAPTTPVTTVRPPVAALDEECSAWSVLEQCVSSGEVWYFNMRDRACVVHYNEDSGRTCRYIGTFGSKDACEARCITVTRAGVCQAQLDAGSSNVFVKPKFYYDLQTASCQPFAYGGSGGGPNRFSTIEFCNQLCNGAGPVPPVPLPQSAPKVTVREGERAQLRCLFHSNPPPRITWRRGAITIDGTVGRFRLLSDGTLEIVSLYRNDSGVYICIADNGLGVARQEVNLVVTDLKDVGIAGIENAVITGELYKRLEIRCLAYGNPPPVITWTHERQMVPFFNSIYEIRENLLTIKRLTNDILGEYTCHAYNKHKATWVVTVQAKIPQVVTQGPFVPTTRRAPHTTRGTTTTTSTTTTTTERSFIFQEPVKVHLSTPYKTLSSGADLQLECETDGYPEPTETWTKDRLPIENSNRISITRSSVVSRLTISSVAVSDSGLYGCHADNGYSSNAEYAQINIQRCVDNPLFANCNLIVRSHYCIHKYYAYFCCKSCVQAGMLDPLSVADLLADQPYRKK